MHMTSFARLTDYPTNSPLIREDMDKRFQNTYMALWDSIKKCFIPTLYYGYTNSKYVFIKSNGDYVELLAQDKTEVKPILPKVGYYNIRGTPHYVIKIPQRQWKRSLCNSIYQILPPVNDPQLQRERLPQSYWYALAEECLNPTYASLDDVKKSLFANIALNNKFVLIKDSNGIPILGYKRYKVAELDFNTRSVIITEPLMTQEIQDLFKYTGISTWTLHQTQTK
jgi:hypothetical protein